MSAKISPEKPSFGWKDAILGGLITLFVTVLAGIAVWYVTKNPEKNEHLIYRVENPASFLSQGMGITFSSLNLRNDGIVRASGISIEAKIPSDARIINKNIAFQSGTSANYVDNSDERHLKLFINKLLTKDKLTLSVLVSGRSRVILQYTVASQDSIAELDSDHLENRINNGYSLTALIALIALIASAMFIQFFIIQYFSYRRFKANEKKFKSLSIIDGSFSASRNNIGFIFMHNGLIKEAEIMFRSDIDAGNAELMTMSHYGTVLLMQGNQDGYKYIQCAEWPTLDNHTIANILVDKFIIALTENKLEIAKKYLIDSINKSSYVKEYYENSILIRDLLETHSLMDFYRQQLSSADD